MGWTGHSLMGGLFCFQLSFERAAQPLNIKNRFRNVKAAGLWCIVATYIVHSVFRLGDLLHFGQLFKACGNNDVAQMALIIR